MRGNRQTFLVLSAALKEARRQARRIALPNLESGVALAAASIADALAREVGPAFEVDRFMHDTALPFSTDREES